MRYFCLFAFALLASTMSYATDNQIPAPLTRNTDVQNSDTAKPIVSTLIFDQSNSDDKQIDINHPTLPIATITTDANAANNSNSTVSGYILNRQLVEQVARPFP